jgi:hypothetical protein
MIVPEDMKDIGGGKSWDFESYPRLSDEGQAAIQIEREIGWTFITFPDGRPSYFFKEGVGELLWGEAIMMMLLIPSEDIPRYLVAPDSLFEFDEHLRLHTVIPFLQKRLELGL